jgi:hypothetical protein
LSELREASAASRAVGLESPTPADSVAKEYSETRDSRGNIDLHINSTQRRNLIVARQLHENVKNAKDRMRSDFLLKPRGFRRSA